MAYQYVLLPEGQNSMYAWGRNCATHGYDAEKSQNILDMFSITPPDGETIDDFWRGHADGPRPHGVIYTIEFPSRKGGKRCA